MVNKVLLITGELTPGVCGICDYNNRLKEQLEKKEDYEFAMKSFRDVTIKDLRTADTVLLNYPCPHFGLNLTTHLKIFIAKVVGCKIVYGMHEFTYVHILRKFVIFLFLLMADQIFSVTEQEIKRLPRFLRKRTQFVPIASNITRNKHLLSRPDSCSHLTLTYFGAFYPAKKVEHLILSAQELVASGMDIRIRLIGARHPQHTDYIVYLEKLITNTDMSFRTEWYIDCEEGRVVELLDSSDVCILPFEEGVTMRRGTFLTCLELGIPVVTTKGQDTPNELLNTGSIFFADDPEGLTEHVERISENPERYRRLAQETKKQLGLVTWEDIGAAIGRLVS